MKLHLLTLLALAPFAFSQTSGLTTGPVTYTIPLTNPAQHMYLDDGSGVFANKIECGTNPQTHVVYPVCPQIVRYPTGSSYANVQASDGTGNCYSLQFGGTPEIVLRTGSCQNSFIGCGSGEYGALYGSGSAWQTVPSGNETLDQNDYPFTNWGGTAVMPGTCTPIQTNYDVQAQIYHHSVRVWAPPANRVPWRLIIMQQIDSASQVVITPTD